MRLTACLLLFVTLAACNKEDGPSADPAVQATMDSMLRNAREGDIDMVVIYYRDLPEADRAKKFVPQLAPALLEGWDALANRAREQATHAGTLRARDKKPPMPHDDVVALLDELAPHAPELATRWSALKAELTAVEQAAFTAERDDKRPRVTVWAEDSQRAKPEQLFAVLVIDCIGEAFGKKWPDIKFLTAAERPSGPGVQVLAATEFDTYKSSSGETHRVTSGAAVKLVPHDLPEALAAALAEPIVALGTSHNPDTIRNDLGLDPTVDLINTGTDAAGAIRRQICANVERELAAR